MSLTDALIAVLIIIAQAFWLTFPAYVSGPFGVIFGGGRPIDGGRKWKDGNRIFGDGKTVDGLVWGILGGIAVGTAMVLLLWTFDIPFMTDFTPVNKTVHIGPFDIQEKRNGLGFITVLLAMSLGAMCGDLVASFAKRRRGLRRGEKGPGLLDQLDFLIGSWTFLLIFFPGWFLDNFGWQHAVVMLIATPLSHRMTNYIAFQLKMKKEPW